MKSLRILLGVLALLSAAHFSQAQWYRLPGPEGGRFNCIAEVGSEIWVGSYGGLYSSSNNGASWQKLSLVSGLVGDIESFNDTVVISYVEINGSLYEAFSISSFNAGSTWQNPVSLGTTSTYEGIRIHKASKALFMEVYGEYYISTNGGLSWSAVTAPGGTYIYEMYSDGQMVIVSVSLPGAPYSGQYYSLNGITPWVLLNNSYQTNSVHSLGSRIFMLTSSQAGQQITSCILRTDDFGVTWDSSYCDTTYIASFFINHDNNIYTYGGSAGTLVSTDSGLTFTQGTMPDLHLWNPGVYVSGGNRLVIDNYGELVLYIPGQQTTIPSISGTTAHYLNSIFSNNNVLFASTSSGRNNFYKSIDGGLTW